MKNAVADPFTRRSCRPTLVTKVGIFYTYYLHTASTFNKCSVKVIESFKSNESLS